MRPGHAARTGQQLIMNTAARRIGRLVLVTVLFFLWGSAVGAAAELPAFLFGGKIIKRLGERKVIIWRMEWILQELNVRALQCSKNLDRAISYGVRSL